MPLTGREPVLGRLKARLRSRASGWGWITVSGPAGAGVSRLLDEVDHHVRTAGEPPLLRLRPEPDARRPFAPLRRALRSLFPQDAGPSLERAVRLAHAGSADEVRVLAAWLGGRVRARDRHGVSSGLLRRFLEHLVPAGPVLVDDLQHLDAATLSVLLPSAQGQGFGVVAGMTGDSALVDGASVWALDPLTPTQVELLIRRWLRHPVTARRLAPILAEHCEGWPGRIVEAVRRLHRQGCFERRERGIALIKTPARWSDGLRSAGAFLDWARTRSVGARRVLDAAAVQGQPDDLDLLAEAAGVSTADVRALLAEATGARGGLAPHRFFATRASRRVYRDRLAVARRDEARSRLVAAWARRAAASTPTADDAVRRLVLAADGGDDYEIEEALEGCLARLPLTRTPPAWHLDALAMAAAALAPGRPGIAVVAHRLWYAGRRQQARSLLEGAALASERAAANLLAQARLRSSDEAIEILEAGLPALAPELDPVQFDAWSVLARLRLEQGAIGAARDAWRLAAATCPPGDLERRARWHAGVATCALAAGRPRAATAHRRRAVRFHLVRGDVHSAARVLLALGDAFIRQGRLQAALAPLTRAADLMRMLDDASGSATAHYLAGRVLTWLNDYHRAVERLRVALTAAENGDDALLPRVHLALASACRGCGDLVQERHHAQMAAELASTALGRVEATAVLARADLRAGVPGAEYLLVRCERDLRGAGFEPEADRARAAIVDARLRRGDRERARAILSVGPEQAAERLAEARLDLASGRFAEACAGFELLAGDADLPADVRATCYAHLAEALRQRQRMPEARAAAVAASALLEVTRRSQADDARLHDVLARVFRDVGEHGRAVGHRSAARRGMRTLARAATGSHERRRLIRTFLRRDPRPQRKTG
ncbi:MAG: AAA family ATPase [Planctomycetota bacterium]|nr:AAA family ATPase [Planctomycetota bacterium]